ncbi:hypothetical protein AUEXF2481DRAFT_725 [Aureobasidium subglaciale EXF-2481]|uniref:Uncharacterized protein n=1 Tax=Aureobasidium subglaciale (strain EXF-2481) TaxID=1043005 RepID=A0A074YXG1_AURSE|nr:uncharacterized protein AUEXF2481DRAFT_725 [Aureobasidium subglaciale EXF-2481]KAI5210323.1 hypothetical protein E4T38_01958 [Aureobasidium subglaciale]KAI5229050.1 hypothetical protein E4T40_01935 [Aureobasidium subglaciale]KAI5232731.1 hypothetical protein E4T41_02155 [Aureobasidium subglaciale]KAI5266121.1 hypothetical protein E4T46_01735 [Aureobasidium subglaciale]KER00835.1 hypothetical protein AUEXF2481DRAFT_725 [Aureobasidium subglaciale EXF-2481]
MQPSERRNWGNLQKKNGLDDAVMTLIRARVTESNPDTAELPETYRQRAYERLVDSIFVDLDAAMTSTQHIWSQSCLMHLVRSSSLGYQRKLERHQQRKSGGVDDEAEDDDNDREDDEGDMEDQDTVDEVIRRPRKRSSPYVDTNYSKNVQHPVSTSARRPLGLSSRNRPASTPQVPVAPSVSKFSAIQLQQYTIRLRRPSGLDTSTHKSIPLWNCVRLTSNEGTKQSSFIDIGELSFDRLKRLAKAFDGEAIVYEDIQPDGRVLSKIEDDDELQAAMHVLIMALKGDDFFLPLGVMRF